jgi:uncharacterized phage infection (PIP) family protein YhgE
MATIAELQDQLQAVKSELQAAQSTASKIDTLTATHAQINQALIEAKRQDALAGEKAEQAELLERFGALATELNAHSEALLDGYSELRDIGHRINQLNHRICNAPHKLTFFDLDLSLIPYAISTGSVWQVDHIKRLRDNSRFASGYTAFYQRACAVLKRWGEQA